MITKAGQIERVYRAEFNVRASRRIIEGRAVPYGVPEWVSDDGISRYQEEWAFGSLARYEEPAMAGRVKLNYTHDDSLLRNWIGRTKHFEQKSDGMYGEWKIDETELGDLILFKVDDLQLRGLSIAARPLKSVDRDGVTVREQAALAHVALVEEPAFSGAQVLAMRERRDVPAGPSPAERLAAMKAQKDQLLR